MVCWLYAPYLDQPGWTVHEITIVLSDIIQL